ncbi:MAG: NAD-dependent epimerase/dehydratase family protein [Candidatus Bathyarchaeota archaeon]|nr:NAD-dependent epimerase/dehydratase family protein [Candidatus Bathyarchaeota archaeon]
MRILVTGGKGFIGSHLVNYLKQKGHWIRNVDIKDKAYLDTKEDEFHCLDLRNYDNAVRVTKDIDWVFNLSANMGGIGFITEVGAEVMHDNALININVMEACRASLVKRVFFSSSACVYNQNMQTSPVVEPLKEEHALPANPDTFYGWEKLFTEFLMKAYSKDYGLDIRIARFHNIYGPRGTYKGGREKAPAALCRKVAEAKDGDSIIIWGDGKQTRSFLYIDDALEAIHQLMLSNFTEPLNIGSDEIISIDELVDIIVKVSGKKLTKTYDPTKPQGVRGRNADLTLIKKVLGWTPRISYEEGLARAYRWIESMVKQDKT